MTWNGNRVLSGQYLLPEFLAEYMIDTALLNETHLQPTRKWSIPAYTIYKPPHGGTAVAVKSSIHHNTSKPTTTYCT